MATEAQALTLVALLENELIRRRGEIERHEHYYRGKQRLKFASDQFVKYHAARYRDFSDNWVQVVADSPVERLTVTGAKVAGEPDADTDLWRVWQVNGLDADSQLGFLAAVTGARCFALVWGDPDDEDTPVVTFEDPQQCIVTYEPGSRRQRRAALKRWQDGNSEFATLYLPHELWKFARPLQVAERSPQRHAHGRDPDRRTAPPRRGLPQLADAMDHKVIPLLGHLDQLGPDLNQLLDRVSQLSHMASRLPTVFRRRTTQIPDWECSDRICC